MDCGNPTISGNGTVNFGTTTFGSEAIFFCQVGFNLTGGPDKATCLETGQWSGGQRVCISKYSLCTTSMPFK